MTGTILKGIGGFYYVCSHGKMYTCKPRGNFRIKDGSKPTIGDEVEFEAGIGASDGNITKIYPRKNVFIRPNVSNVTQVCIVLTPKKPNPDLLLIDRLIIQGACAKIDVFIVLNKCDLVGKDEINDFYDQYKDYNFLSCSTTNSIGLDAIKSKLKNNITFFAGQSGVGKSSIINALFSSSNMEVGEVSNKLQRGKHTTRHVELVLFNEINGGIIDTPGFSFFDFSATGDINLDTGYKEFTPYLNQCKFVGCVHKNEPECGIKEQLGKAISLKRYQRYLILLEELQQYRRKKYD